MKYSAVAGQRLDLYQIDGRVASYHTRVTYLAKSRLCFIRFNFAGLAKRVDEGLCPAERQSKEDNILGALDILLGYINSPIKAAEDCLHPSATPETTFLATLTSSEPHAK